MGRMLDALRGNRALVPTASLPTEAWCEAPGICRISVVWPWYAVPQPEPLVDNHGRPTVTPAIEIRAPRTDGVVALAIWTDQGGGFVVGPAWAGSLMRMYGGRVEWDTALALGGLMGRLVRLRTATDVVWRLLVPREHDTVTAELRVPHADADGYWPHLETMLSTWSWSS